MSFSTYLIDHFHTISLYAILPSKFIRQNFMQANVLQTIVQHNLTTWPTQGVIWTFSATDWFQNQYFISIFPFFMQFPGLKTKWNWGGSQKKKSRLRRLMCSIMITVQLITPSNVPSLVQGPIHEVSRTWAKSFLACTLTIRCSKLCGLMKGSVNGSRRIWLIPTVGWRSRKQRKKSIALLCLTVILSKIATWTIKSRQIDSCGRKKSTWVKQITFFLQ